jgi:lauroyl/myristoyl acyltransferase
MSSPPLTPSSPSSTQPAPVESATQAREPVQSAWTRHVLNSGTIYRWTYNGVSKLPRSVCYGIAHVSTWLSYRLLPKTTDAVIENLRVVLPDADERQLRRLALETYRSYARDVVDFIRTIPLDKATTRQMFEFETSTARPMIDNMLSTGKGILTVAGHFGNWEIGALMLRAYDYPLSVLTMAHAADEANRMRQEMRTRLGIETIEVRQSMDTALQIRRHLANKRIIAILMDRYVDKDRVPVTFFGRRAYFLRTPALMAYMTGAPLFPVAIVRKGPGAFRCLPSEPIYVSREGNRDEEVARASQEFATVLEGLIRQWPQCWYQFYPYWAAQDVA